MKGRAVGAVIVILALAFIGVRVVEGLKRPVIFVTEKESGR